MLRGHPRVALGFIAASLTFPAFAAAASAPPPDICSTYVGQKPTLASFQAVRTALPAIPPQDSYESTADYERRLARSAIAAIAPALVQRRPTHPGEGLSYDADRQILTVYGSAFGTGQINFSSVFPRSAYRAREDNFTSAIGFKIETLETGRESFEATNGFGATVTVTRIDQKVSAVWERAGRLGESQFLGVGSFKPVARIPMKPNDARALIEGGSAALLFVPKPPFVVEGMSVLEASFTRPRENRDTVTVIVADVQCGFLLSQAGTILYAFPVR